MSDCLILNSDGSPLSITPLSLVTWKEAIRLQILEKVNVIDVYSNWVIHSAHMALSVPSVIMTKIYYDKTYNVKFTKQNLLYLGNFTCAYCLRKFKSQELTLDHIIPRSLGGRKSFDNICLACGPCNHSRGNNVNIQPKIKPIRPTYFDLVNSRKKHPVYLKNIIWNDYLRWDPKLIVDKPLFESKFKFDEDQFDLK